MLSNHSHDQRLQFHLELMGRASSRADCTAAESILSPLSPPSTINPSFIDPLHSLTPDPSPYHDAILIHPSTPARPSSRASSTNSSTPAHHALPPVPPLPLYSPSSLSSCHSSAPSAHPHPFLLPPIRPSSSQSSRFFDPDYEAERVRLAKLEWRRSTGLALTRPTIASSRASSASSIESVRSFRSVGRTHFKTGISPLGLTPPVPSVYRPSPLHSTSTPHLGAVETDAEKKQHRKEMKEAYEKMRAARIEEERRLAEKHSAQESHHNWFSSRFKHPKVPSSNNPIQEAHVTEERRSTSMSSSLESTVPSSSMLDHRSNSTGTAPTSEEGPFQANDQSHKGNESPDKTSDQSNSFKSPTVDPFRKSMLPGQVPPTPTKITMFSSATPKSMRILTPARTNLHKLNRLLFDSFKSGGGQHGSNHHQHENQENKRKSPNPTLESNIANSDNNDACKQSGWLDSIKSIRSKPRSTRRKTLMGMLMAEKEMPPPVPKLPEHIPN